MKTGLKPIMIQISDIGFVEVNSRTGQFAIGILLIGVMLLIVGILSVFLDLIPNTISKVPMKVHWKILVLDKKNRNRALISGGKQQLLFSIKITPIILKFIQTNSQGVVN